MNDYRIVAHLCAKYRRKIGIKQKQVAIETGYSEKTVSAFEHGRCNNAIILLWYLRHGLPRDYIEGCGNNEAKRKNIERIKGVRYT